MRNLTFSEFKSKYGGFKENKINNKGNKYMFSPNGDERMHVLLHLQNNQRTKIWTMMKINDNLIVKAGDHVTPDRVGYFISKRRWNDRDEEIYNIIE